MLNNYIDPGASNFHEQVAGYANPYAFDSLNANGYDEASGLFDSIASAVSSVGKAVGGAVSGAAKGVASGVNSVANVVQKGVGAITNNPLWDIARTGVSFIPGVGTAVSAGMAGASAIGRGESLKDIALSAAKGAIPGGPAAQAAFDVALGLAKGKNVTDAILEGARNQLPGGDLGKAAFDAATAIAKGKAFDQVALEQLRARVPGGAAGKAAFDTAISQFKAGRGAPGGGGRIPTLNLTANRVANSMVANPSLQRASASRVASELGSSIDNVQKAIAALANSWSNTRNRIQWTDVGSGDSLEACCEREAIPMGVNVGSFDTGYLQDDTSGPMFMPALAISKPYVQALYRNGHTGIRQNILAHGLLARLHHNTGELDGAGGWKIQSGDTPSGIAQKLTGTATRWKELLAVNPTLKVVTVGSTTQIQPFNPGQRITIPTSWLGTASPAPQSPAAPGSAPTSGAQPTIRQGDTGSSVKAWQLLLQTLGSNIVGTADGIFGPATATATKAYQTARGLQADGVVGPKTWSTAMAEANAKTGNPPPVVVSPPPIVVVPPVTTSPTSPIPIPIPIPPVSLPPVTLPPSLPTPSSGPPVVLQPPPVVVGPAVPSGASQVAIAAAEAALAYFYQQHPDAVFVAGSPAYGLDPADHSGTWDPRDKTAMLGFQKWANDNPGKVGFPLPVTGEPDELSVKALQAITAADLSKATGTNVPAPPPIIKTTPTAPGTTPPITKAGVGGDSGLGLLLGAGLVLAVIAGAGGKRAA